MLGRFFYLLLEAIKKRHAKLASIAVETRKATTRDKDHDGDAAAEPTLVPARVWPTLAWLSSGLSLAT